MSFFIAPPGKERIIMKKAYPKLIKINKEVFLLINNKKEEKEHLKKNNEAILSLTNWLSSKD